MLRIVRHPLVQRTFIGIDHIGVDITCSRLFDAAIPRDAPKPHAAITFDDAKHGRFVVQLQTASLSSNALAKSGLVALTMPFSGGFALRHRFANPMVQVSRRLV